MPNDITNREDIAVWVEHAEKVASTTEDQYLRAALNDFAMAAIVLQSEMVRVEAGIKKQPKKRGKANV